MRRGKFPPGVPPGVQAPPCFVPRSFEDLRSLTCAQLAQLGCRRWDDSGLMLFPARWFDGIPEGFELRDILGRVVKFSRRDCSRDARCGVLGYGVVGREATPTERAS